MTERKAKFRIVSFLLVSIFCLTLASEGSGGRKYRKPFYATVIKIIDGDTIDVRDSGGNVERVRVYGIDSPERWEPCHKMAARFLKENLLNRDVKIIPQGRGRYGRLLGFVMMERKSLGLELVKGGLARVYSNGFAPENSQTYRRYQMAQIHAMSGHFGIWGNQCE
ncbi:MAG: nuclease [bacterium]|nr:MAG: nuclease [bacterium]